MSILGKLFHAGEAQANKAANEALDADPIAVMNLDNEKDAAKIHEIEPQMRQIKGQVNGLKRQVDDEAQEIAIIQGKIDQALKASEESTDPAEKAEYDQAANLLDQQVQGKEAAHTATIKAFNVLNTQYTTAAQNIREANDRIAVRQQKAQTLGRALALSEVVKTAVTTAHTVSAADFSHVGQSSRAEEIAQSRIDANMAAGDVQEDLYAKPVDPLAAINAKLEAKVAASTSNGRLAARKAALGIGTPAPAIKTTTPVVVTTVTTVTPELQAA